MLSKEQKYEYNQQYYYTHQEEILEQKKDYEKKNKEAIQRYRKKHYETHKESYLASQRAYYTKIENRPKKIFSKTRERARESGVEFSISVEDIKIPEYCPYLGIKLTHDLGKGQQLSNSSIDRIDNTKGYLPDNIRIISRLANNMKSSSTREQRVAFANAILNNPTF